MGQTHHEPHSLPPSGGKAPRKPSLWRRLLLAFAAAAFALALAELALQIVGLEVRAGRLERDALLGWRNRPGWSGPVFAVSSSGFLVPAAEGEESKCSPEKPPGTIRVVCLGDSCTAGDLLPAFAQTYPSQLARRLGERHPEARFEVINAGVGGYSSFQGRTWLEREIIHYRPDLLIVYFGWNDHWPARAGGPDKVVSNSLAERARTALGWSKLLQLSIKLYHVARGNRVVARDAPAAGGGPGAREGALRVSLEDYAQNLRAMVRLVRDGGGEAILVTAPNFLALARDEGEAPAPRSLPGGRADAEAIVRLHAAYNDVVRRVAAEEGVELVDAASDFPAGRPPAELFWNPPDDFIHLSAEGYARLAAKVAASPAVARLAEPH